MKQIKHHHQTLLPDDPTKDISANEWNEDHDAIIDLFELNEDSGHRTVSDIEKAVWNSKQNALGISSVVATLPQTAVGITGDLDGKVTQCGNTVTGVGAC